MKIQKIGIIGMGAVGIMYAKMMQDVYGYENVFFIVNKARKEKYEQDGLYYNGERIYFNVLCDDYADIKADFIFFITKYTGLKQAIESVRNFVADHTIFVSGLNGIVSEQDIARVYGDKHLLYCSVQAMDTAKIGNKVTATSSGYFALGCKNDYTKQDLQDVCECLDACKIAYKLPQDINYHMWSKFMLNVGCNQVSAAHGLSYSGLLEEQNLKLMLEAMREAKAVANASGVNLTDNDINQWIDVMRTLDPDSMTSMRQDIINKNKTELELFGGTVCRLGIKYDIPTPVNDELCKMIQDIEADF